MKKVKQYMLSTALALGLSVIISPSTPAFAAGNYDNLEFESSKTTISDRELAEVERMLAGPDYVYKSETKEALELIDEMNPENVLKSLSKDKSNDSLEDENSTKIIADDSKKENPGDDAEDVNKDDADKTSITKKEIDEEDIDKKIENMDLDEKIGQMLMLEFRFWEDENGEEVPVTELNDDIKKAIAKYKIGGVILFAENVVETEQTTRLTDAIQKVAIENNMPPLFISIDQEGGIVVRLGTGTSLPGNMALGATEDEKLAYRYGQIIAEEIKSLGINVDLAPSLDVNNNPNNPVIGLRSISSDPDLVAKLGSQIIKGLQETNVSSAVKHFPGHGDTAVDSHLGLPVVEKTYEEVSELELLPFVKASKDGVDMIMTAHISYPELEKDTVISKKDGSEIGIPATLSDDIITGIIRNKMLYDGIVITDAMNMKAISEHFGEEDAVIMAIKAGVDIPLMPTKLTSNKDLEKLDGIIARIKEAIRDGEISEDNIDKSVKRILSLKAKRNILDLDKYETPIDKKVENALKIVGSKEHFDDQRIITDRAITVTKNIDDILPLYPKKGEKVLIYTPYENEIPGFEYGFNKLQEENVIDKEAKLDVIAFPEIKSEEDLENIKETLMAYAKDYDYIIAVSEIGKTEKMDRSNPLSIIPDMLTTFAKENNKPSIIISLGKPYDLDRYQNSDAHVLAYGAKGMDPTEKGKDPVKTFGPNIPFSLDIVFGKVKSSGKLPVDVPKLTEDYEYSDVIAYKVGYGLITKLKNTDEESTDSKDTKIIEKIIPTVRASSKISNFKENKKSYDVSPKTGISGSLGVMTILATSLIGFTLTKKK